MPRRRIPALATETKEANWWYRNRRRLDRDFAAAARKGELTRLDKAMLAARAAVSRVISIRLPEPDLQLARRQAAKRGLPYQTYIKSLLHQALTRNARKGT